MRPAGIGNLMGLGARAAPVCVVHVRLLPSSKSPTHCPSGRIPLLWTPPSEFWNPSLSHRSLPHVSLPSQEVVDLVRDSCADLPEGSTLLAGCFYRNLFKMAPELREMFADDLGPQQQRMADALLAVVRHLDSPDEIAEYLQQLGAQHHRQLGVLPEHYPHVGRALVRAVSEVSQTWTSSMSSSWVLVYRWITAHMLAGAREAASASSERPGTH